MARSWLQFLAQLQGMPTFDAGPGGAVPTWTPDATYGTPYGWRAPMLGAMHAGPSEPPPWDGGYRPASAGSGALLFSSTQQGPPGRLDPTFAQDPWGRWNMVQLPWDSVLDPLGALAAAGVSHLPAVRRVNEFTDASMAGMRQLTQGR